MEKSLNYYLLALLLVLTSPLFFWGGPNYYSPRLLNEFWNLGHLFFFGLSVVLLDSYWCAKRHSILFRVILTIFILVFAGFAIELVQRNMVDRSFSWEDLFRDLSGGMIVLFWRIGRGHHRSVLFRIVSIIILFINFIPLGCMALDEYRAHRDFPLLSGFENKTELSRWNGGGRLSRDSDVRRKGNYSAKIALTTDQYSGIFLRHFPGDWRGWNGLAFSVFNPDPEIKLHYRVHDILHRGDMQEYTNHYNGNAVLYPGWNDIVIPMTDILSGPRERTMDLAQIRGFGIFVIRQMERRVIYLDNVRLF